MKTDFSLPTYTLYFDTNTAYSKKPCEAVSQKLCASLKKARTLTAVDVRVPDVVFEELIYQQFMIAKSASENLKKNAQTLKDTCGSCDVVAPNDEDLETHVRKQFEIVASTQSIKVIATPVDEIDWRTVVRDSCWRMPPFEKPTSEDNLAEKGFRDKVILETIKQNAKTVKIGVIAIITGDNLLRNTFNHLPQMACPVEIYSGAEEFLGHLELLDETKSNQLTESVLSKAESVFFSPNNPNCVATSQNVFKQLTAKYSQDLAQPNIWHIPELKISQNPNAFSTLTQPLAGTNMLSAHVFDEIRRWAPITPLTAYASKPIYQSGPADGRFHWRSTVTLVRLLRRESPQWSRLYGQPEERIRLKEIDVLWSCLIDTNTADFSDFKIDDYELGMRDAFVEADLKLRSKYDLPLFPGYEEPNT